MTENTQEMLDVAVVGGGVGGAYVAWRLMTSQPQQAPQLAEWAQARGNEQLRIGLFEGSDRIGGRLLSVTPPGMPHVCCELGGMRYMSSQPLVRSLIENELRLKTRPLPVDEPGNIAYLRGRHLRLSELTDPDKVPFNLSWSERAQLRLPNSNLLGYAIDQIIPGVTSLRGKDLQELLRSYQFQGRHIYEHGFWNLLAHSLSSEAYDFAKTSGGYDTVMLNWNAADTIMLNFDFAPGVTFTGLVDGYEQLPVVLCERFREAGGEVAMRSPLRSFDRAELSDGSEGVRLLFANRSAPVLARALVLAMPRRSVELLEPSGAVLDPRRNRGIERLIRSVTPIPLFKMFVCYQYPWWDAVGVAQGRSVTDLPIRQCYYWAVEGAQPGADPHNQNAVLMATYDDTLNVDFWGGLRSRVQPPFETRINRHLEAHPGSPEWHEHHAPEPMVQEIQRQLKEMHGLRFAPEPYAAAYRDWGEDPYGGGVNFWNIHEKSWEVIPRIAQPRPGFPVYICGEAYSNGQGWVEGALETAELVLQDHFHLAAPEWVSRPTDS
ncbi:MAG: FAD-dependent oxidoreductase [Gemmatimonadetes bacterium]|jgi:hypothetical protein|nr:FAD-dependent oxidoreductase [Gemmatimonadota bacterium]